MKKLFLIIIFTMITSCSVDPNQKHEFISQGSYFIKNSGTWIPSEIDVKKGFKKIEMIFKHPEFEELSPKNYYTKKFINYIYDLVQKNEYRVQIFGIMSEGKKKVFYSFIILDGSYDLEHYSVIEFDGKTAWKFCYDPETDKCEDLYFNGYGYIKGIY